MKDVCYLCIIVALCILCWGVWLRATDAEEREWQSVMDAVAWQTKAAALESRAGRGRK